MIGTLVNAAAVVAGSATGTFMRRLMPGEAGKTALAGMGLATVFIGLDMGGRAISAPPPDGVPFLAILVALAAGAVAGERLLLEQRLEALGRMAERSLGARFGGDGSFARSFVASSLLFVVGPMSIVGSLSDGMAGDHRILLTKSVMDGIASVALASTLGPGVFLSAATVLAYQGTITLAGAHLGRLLSAATVASISAAGGLLIVAIGLNMVGATRIRTANLLPAIVIAPILSWVWGVLSLP